MNNKHQSQYDRVASAIEYIQTHFKQQPSLDEIAQSIDLSPHHFHRLFTEWAGVSPKKFMQLISLEYVKGLLRDKQVSLFEASYDVGLSSPSRLHDLFINIEAMTPGEYKRGGATLEVNYAMYDSPFGTVLIGSTMKGICHLSFIENDQSALVVLEDYLPDANFKESEQKSHKQALSIFTEDWSQKEKIKLHLRGSPFQLKIWKCLLTIQQGQLTTYGDIAKQIAQPKASRAVGTAIGKNPVAYLIPCHRVIQGSGALGGYRWGITRKTAMIAWEASQQ